MTTEDLSCEEMRQALDVLTDVELLKLRKAAILLCTGRFMIAEDLLQEAVCRALEGRRRCPRNVPVVVFLVNVMRSLVSANQKSSKDDPIVLAAKIRTVDSDDDGMGVLAEIEDQTPNPLQLLIEKDTTKAIMEDMLSLFEDDADAELVLLDLFAGFTADEVRRDLGLNEQAYATIRRRMRRRINQRFPDGWKLS